MSEAVYIKSNGSTARKRCLDVSKKISDAATDINKAREELNNVDYVDVSYEIDQLKTMYKNDNTQVSEFEAFASTLESMVDEYISTDKACAQKIKSSGRKHRKETGLPQSLALATISASFDEIGDKLEQTVEDIKNWVDGVIDWFSNSLSLDGDSYFQGIGGLLQLIASVGVMAGIASAGTVAAAVGTFVVAAIGIYMGIDKLTASVIDIANIYETDGDTVTEKAVNNPFFNVGYELTDLGISVCTSNILSKLSKVILGFDNLIKDATIMDKLGDVAEVFSAFIESIKVMESLPTKDDDILINAGPMQSLIMKLDEILIKEFSSNLIKLIK